MARNRTHHESAYDEYPLDAYRIDGVCMIGDDRNFIVDPSDVSPLDEGAYCRECGQIGCRHGAISAED